MTGHMKKVLKQTTFWIWCGHKVVERKTTGERMDMLGLKQTIDWLAPANGVRWCGDELRRDDNSVLLVALDLEVSGKRKRGRPKKI